jgi:hypothetical protein
MQKRPSCSRARARLRLSLGVGAVLRLSAWLIVSVPALSGCELGKESGGEGERAKAPPEPRGPVAQEERAIASFVGLVVPSRAAVTVKPGKTTRARLRGPENYLKDLTIKSEKRTVNGAEIDVLVIALDKRIKLPLPEVEVETPSLVYVEAGGPARVKVGDFTGPHLTLRGDRASKIELAAASYAEVDAQTKMAARILAPEVAIEKAHLSAQGASRIQVGQVASLKKNSEGGGRVSYQGTPEIVQ